MWEAVEYANAMPGADSISLKKGCTYKFLSPVPFTDAMLVVTDDLAIYGNGAEIVRSSKGADIRHFDVSGAGTELRLSDVTLKYGRVESPYGTFPAAGSVLVGAGAALLGDKLTVEGNSVHALVQPDVVLAAGGILNNGGTVTLRKSSVKRNTVSSASGPGAVLGGGVAVAGAGTTTIYKSVVKDNHVEGHAPLGSLLVGGGLVTADALALTTVEASTVTGNTVEVRGAAEAAGAGGVALAGTTTLLASEVAVNEVDAEAVAVSALSGGILNRGALTVDDPDDDDERSEIIGNEVACPDRDCAARGGGFLQDSPSAISAFNFTAIKDNQAKARKGVAFGGGLFVGGGAVELNEAIVKRNEAEGEWERGGGIFADPAAAVSVGASDVYKNEPNDCYGVPAC